MAVAELVGYDDSLVPDTLWPRLQVKLNGPGERNNVINANRITTIGYLPFVVMGALNAESLARAKDATEQLERVKTQPYEALVRLQEAQVNGSGAPREALERLYNAPMEVMPRREEITRQVVQASFVRNYLVGVYVQY